MQRVASFGMGVLNTAGAAASATYIAATDGLGAVAGGAAALVYNADHAATNFTEAWTGEAQETNGSKLLQAAGVPQNTANTAYNAAGLLMMKPTSSSSSINSFGDLASKANVLADAPKGKGQLELTGLTMKEVYAGLKNTGFTIQKISRTTTNATGAVFLGNAVGESVIIRKSLQGGYKTFDTISGQILGKQTDIRIPFRR